MTGKKAWTSCLGALLVATGIWSTATADAPDPTTYFVTKVKPLLESRCISCHGTQKQKANLRMDSRAALLKGGDSGPALIVGDAANSLIMQAVQHKHESLEMPPKEKLEPEAIANLKKWIDTGAVWPEQIEVEESLGIVDDNGTPIGNAWDDQRNPIRKIWAGQRLDLWSLRRPLRPKVPRLQKAKAAQTAVDHFVFARQEAKGLSTSPPADRRTLIRRLYFDLLGLPPTPEAVTAFVEDPADDAYQKLVEELLASHHYGERWARHWLDVVRYADTTGFERDEFRPNTFRYRDYVIRAFNQDKPYDQFIREQLAGDEMVAATPTNQQETDRLIATGFMRLGLYDSTRATFDENEKGRNELMADLVNTTSSAFLGLTMSCANCHDHKYDPISQADHFRMRAFFAGVKFDDGMVIETSAQQKRIDEHNAVIEKKIAQEQAKINELLATAKDHLIGQRRAAFPPRIIELLAHLDQLARKSKTFLPDKIAGLRLWFDAGRIEGLEDGQTLTKWADASGNGNDLVQEGDAPKFAATAFNGAPAVRFDGGQLLSCSTPKGLDGSEGLTAIIAFKPDQTSVNQLYLSSSAESFGVQVYNHRLYVYAEGYGSIPYRSVEPLVLSSRLDGASPEPANRLKLFVDGTPQSLQFTGALASMGKTTRITVGGPFNATQSFAHGLIAEILVYDNPLSESDRVSVEQYLASKYTVADNRPIQQEVKPYLEKLKVEDKDVVASLNETQKAKHKESTEKITKLTSKKLKANTALAMLDSGTEAPATHIFFQGDFNNALDEVPPGVLSVLDPNPAVINKPDRPNSTGRRTALANWIASEENPFTARVLANRIWQHYFGTGIVATPNDFGFSGIPPTHPQLLDYLASELIDSGWSVKHVQRLILLSATYRQSSAEDPTRHAIDPENKLLWRQNIQRLDAETLRDAILTAAGTLLQASSGTPIWPVVDEEILKTQVVYPLDNPLWGWIADPIETNDVRSIFLIQKRCSPLPYLRSFDLPDPNVSCGRRDVTTIAPQALSLLNSPFAIRQARAFAQHVAAKSDGDPAKDIDRAVWLALGRAPDEEELRIGLDLIAEHTLVHAKNIESEEATDTTPELAALTDFCRLLINLNEFIYID